ncbi:hypothetical protein CROQUDRAFT_99050 [Cronartium quercuum f. sp. fusiforme G11]|uniref:PB1 domain-containing protein n=1 Tax=Cronartium quercuum f. sp. fusiforme G11 TaxID=708437 RepID=A0A9P6NCI7_9BASI|nr:hypothetical protein CROQUDRAFT_99050 [Cronartium quercuum f. sp. fusiforme G11]
MSLKAEIETWSAALDFYDAQNFDQALSKFEDIADSSKILFNIGLIYATLGEHEVAIENFHAATNLDQYLAVAYFQCGVSNFLLGFYEEAIKDFEDALLYLRGNLTIDYDQLGLKFRLYSCEVLFNKGLAMIYLGNEVEGMADMQEAKREKQTAEHAVIDEAISDRGDGYTVFSIPVGVLYRPSANKVKNLASKNYLGQAKLVAATDATETFVGFTGAARAAAKNGLDVVTSAGPSSSGSVDDSMPPIQRRGTTAARIEGTSTRAGSLTANDLRRRPSDNTSAVTPSRLQRSATSNTYGSRSKLAPTIEEALPRSSSRQPTDSRLNRLAEKSSYGDLLDSYDYDQTGMAGGEHYKSDRIADWAKINPGPSSVRAGNSSSIATPVRGGSLRRAPTIGSQYDDGYGSGADYPDTVSSFTPMTKIRVKLHHASDTRGMSVDPEMPLSAFSNKVIKKFSLSPQMSMKFRDEEGSMISLLDEDDWESAVDTARSYAKGRAEGKIEVWVEDT